MTKDWTEISTDDLLNWEGPQTNQIARYDRIMRQRETVALENVSLALFDLKSAMHKSTERLETSINEAAEKQGRAQKIGIVLTVVVAIATLAYTGTTWLSVQAQREANSIQRELLSSPNAEPPQENASPKL